MDIRSDHDPRIAAVLREVTPNWPARNRDRRRGAPAHRRRRRAGPRNRHPTRERGGPAGRGVGVAARRGLGPVAGGPARARGMAGPGCTCATPGRRAAVEAPGWLRGAWRGRLSRTGTTGCAQEVPAGSRAGTAPLSVLAGSAAQIAATWTTDPHLARAQHEPTRRDRDRALRPSLTTEPYTQSHETPATTEHASRAADTRPDRTRPRTRTDNDQGPGRETDHTMKIRTRIRSKAREKAKIPKPSTPLHPCPMVINYAPGGARRAGAR